MTTLRDVEAALRDMLRLHDDAVVPDHVIGAPVRAESVLAALAADREAARRARPVVERWLAADPHSVRPHTARAVLLALGVAFVSRGMTPVEPRILAAYDRATAEPPQPEPGGPLVEHLIAALMVAAVQPQPPRPAGEEPR